MTIEITAQRRFKAISTERNSENEIFNVGVECESYGMGTGIIVCSCIVLVYFRCKFFHAT